MKAAASLLSSMRLASAVKLTGAHFLAMGGIAVLCSFFETTKSQERKLAILLQASTIAVAGVVAFSIIGPTSVGYGTFYAFAGNSVVSLGPLFTSNSFLFRKWRDLSLQITNPIYHLSLIVNLAGGVYSLISLPYNSYNVASTFFSAVHLMIASR
ncbi:MAG: hypothetical protein WC222_02275 [Parachlamydiales bacterium]|jgi:hypothetical protein